MKTINKGLRGSLRLGRIAWMVGLMACAAPERQAESRPLRAQTGGYEVQVLVDGAPAHSFWHQGEDFVLGHMGDRYTLRVTNHTGRRVEAVVSVDGRDVIDGKPGDFRNKRGYMVPAWGSVDIDGWRLSQWQAAAFRFSSVSDSYAGRMGNARNVGVIGVAVFPERVYHRAPPVVSRPTCCDDERHDNNKSAESSADRYEGAAPSRSAPQPAAPAELADAPAAKRGAGESAPTRRLRPGLGTEFGEAVSSQIEEVEFVRANASEPSIVLGVRYNDRQGLIALGIDVDGCCAPDDSDLRRTADPFPVSHHYARPPAGWSRN